MPINYNLYPANWFSELRPAVLARARNSCEGCGLPNYAVYRIVGAKEHFIESRHESYKSAKKKVNKLLDNRRFHKDWKIVKLSIAHLDHDINNNDLANLKALCQRCHLKHDRMDNARRKKYGKYYEIGQLKINLLWKE